MTKKEVKEKLAQMHEDVKFVAWNWNLWKEERIVSFVGIYTDVKSIAISECYYVEDGKLYYMPESIWVKPF